MLTTSIIKFVILLDPTVCMYVTKMVCFIITLGFLLRDIKDFWRVALLTSLLLSVVDGMKEDQETGQLDFQLEKLRESYLTIEETICELGKR